MIRHLGNWEGKAYCGRTDGTVVNDNTNDCEDCRREHKKFVGACSDGNCRHRRYTHVLNEESAREGYTYCLLDTGHHGAGMLAKPGEEPTCDECLRVGRMHRGVFQNARKAGHVVYKHDSINRRGNYAEPRYEIYERYIADGAISGGIFVAGFSREEDRDNIFDTMLAGGYCGHTKKSWIRSIR